MKLSLNTKIFLESEKKLNRIDLTNSNLEIVRIQLLVEADDVFSFEYETITRSEVYS